MTLKELMTTDFSEEYQKKVKNKSMLNKKRDRDKREEKISKEEKERNPNYKKYQNNKNIIQHLENNQQIGKGISFEKILKRTFSDLFNEYLESNEFEEDVLDLLEEDDVNPNYVIEYIIKAIEFIEYFSKSN